PAMDGPTALQMVAHEGLATFCQLLLCNGRDASREKNTRQPGQLEEISSTLDVDQQDQHGRTALHYSARSGFVNVLDVLLDANANVNIQDWDGWTALHVASHQGYIGAVRCLLAAGA